MRKFAFTDIHGCLQSFEALLEKIAPDSDDELYFLGDYIDRGPDSKGVIDRIINLETEGFYVQCLRGNHEQMLLDGRNSDQDFALWAVNGGTETLRSFGTSYPQDIPAFYIDWIDRLPPYLEVDEYILVHAGLNFDTPNPFDNQFSMLWIRKWYDDINYNWLKDRIIVHGHTPMPKNDIFWQRANINNQQFLDIDAGCVHKGKRPGMGNLCAFEMTNKRLYFQGNVDF